MFSCKYGSKEICSECVNDFYYEDNIEGNLEDYSYLSHGRCCGLGYYFDTIEGKCVKIEDIPQCTYLDNDKCWMCESDYQLFEEKNKCCPNGTYPEGDLCISKSKDEHCNSFELVNGEYKCTECDSTDFYISNGNCCENFKFYSSTYNRCIDIFKQEDGGANTFLLFNCKYVDSDGKCIECEDNYYL